VTAIRADKLVGRGTCSTLSECWDDVEIAEILEEEGITTLKGAIEWARDYEGLRTEQALNARWGEDDDPQLLAWQAWNAALDEDKASEAGGRQ